jgi:predicted TIM-barrel fold metal-dependent hydrolase
MIVDAQVHLWKAESPDWPWVPGRKGRAAPSKSFCRDGTHSGHKAGIRRAAAEVA